MSSKDKKCYVYNPAEKSEIGHTEFEILTVPSEARCSLEKYMKDSFTRKPFNNFQPRKVYQNKVSGQDDISKRQVHRTTSDRSTAGVKHERPTTEPEVIPSSTWTRTG